jgi:hypothetical protein
MSVDDYVDFDPYWDSPSGEEEYFYEPMPFGWGAEEPEERAEEHAVETSESSEFGNSGWGLSGACE